ncbi:hypothetical protein [Rhodonellum sp.]|uniref:hypothetical protein n=1 Tax=Rhodonellum sp. TaxID=2231180 RepID=UPI002715900A|nr:hypothetical protein [Rhodonellum sp.]MDO9554518.1 hypothetical protein [Rhodonellum sp.]
MTIKNLRLINDLLTVDQLIKLEHGALQHQKYSRIEFKVLEVKDNAITIRVSQEQSPKENYLTSKDLSDRTKELFGLFLPGFTIHARALAYVPPKVDAVTPGWVQTQMQRKGMEQKDILETTGLDKTNLSAWISGKRSMSQPVKAMFYYMLK